MARMALGKVPFRPTAFRSSRSRCAVAVGQRRAVEGGWSVLGTRHQLERQRTQTNYCYLPQHEHTKGG